MRFLSFKLNTLKRSRTRWRNTCTYKYIAAYFKSRIGDKRGKAGDKLHMCYLYILLTYVVVVYVWLIILVGGKQITHDNSICLWLVYFVARIVGVLDVYVDVDCECNSLHQSLTMLFVLTASRKIVHNFKHLYLVFRFACGCAAIQHTCHYWVWKSIVSGLRGARNAKKSCETQKGIFLLS